MPGWWSAWRIRSITDECGTAEFVPLGCAVDHVEGFSPEKQDQTTKKNERDSTPSLNEILIDSFFSDKGEWECWLQRIRRVLLMAPLVSANDEDARVSVICRSTLLVFFRVRVINDGGFHSTAIVYNRSRQRKKTSGWWYYMSGCPTIMVQLFKRLTMSIITDPICSAFTIADPLLHVEKGTCDWLLLQFPCRRIQND